MINKAYRDALLRCFMDSIESAGKLMEEINWAKVSTERITILDCEISALMLNLIDLPKEENHERS